MARARYFEVAIDTVGRPVAGVTVNVYQAGTTTPIVETIYAADTGVATLLNPLTANAQGEIEFYLDVPKRITLAWSKTGYVAESHPADVINADAFALDTDLPGAGSHPDLAAHDTLGLATQAELDAALVLVNGTYERLFIPEGYGCVGDGTTNDTTNFRAAVAAAVAAGGKLVATAGATYLVDSITVTAGTLNMDLTGATLKMRTGANLHLINLSGTGALKLVGGTVDGNKAGQASNGRGISNTAAAVLVVRNVDFINTLDHAVFSTSAEARITDSTALNCVSGFHLRDCSGSRVSRCGFENINRSALLVTSEDSAARNVDRVRVNDIDMKNVGSDGTPYVGLYVLSGADGSTYGVVRSTFSNVTIDTAGFIGALFSGDFLSADGIEVRRSGQVTAAGGYGIWLHDGRNITLNGSHSNECWNSGIVASKAFDLAFLGCSSHGNRDHGFYLAKDTTATNRYPGNVATNNRGVVFVGCTATENSQPISGTPSAAGAFAGFHTSSYAEVTLIGCIATDEQASKTQDRGLTNTSGAADLILIANQFQHNLNANGINNASANGVRVNFANAPATQDFSPRRSITAGVTGAYSTINTDDLLKADASGGAVTIAIATAAASYPGRMLTIVKIDSSANTVTIDPAGAETINGADSLVLANQYDSVQIMSDGTNWFILNSSGIGGI